MSTNFHPNDVSAPLLLIGPTGEIEHANAAATQIFGPCIGKDCRSTLRPRNEKGAVVCDTGCPRGARRQSVRWTEVTTHAHVSELRCANMGERVIVSMSRPAPVPSGLSRLTQREREVLTLVSRGMNTSRIATFLGISRSTVRTHVERCRTKLNARSQAEAVTLALQTHQLTF